MTYLAISGGLPPELWPAHTPGPHRPGHYVTGEGGLGSRARLLWGNVCPSPFVVLTTVWHKEEVAEEVALHFHFVHTNVFHYAHKLHFYTSKQHF